MIKTFVSLWIASQLQKFFGNFVCEYYEGIKTGYHGCLLRNEGKDMKQQKFFTANNKQYTVV